MSLFILGLRNDLFCLNLQYSAICIKKILNVMQRIAKKKKNNIICNTAICLFKIDVKTRLKLHKTITLKFKKY